MRFTGVSAAVAALLGANLAHAQFLINELSFGYTGRLVNHGTPMPTESFPC
jgi:hypothetical protein